MSEFGIPEHKNKEVQAALICLLDALCQWERDTGINSMLVLREQGGYCCRAHSGKCVIPKDIGDELLLSEYRG